VAVAETCIAAIFLPWRLESAFPCKSGLRAILSLACRARIALTRDSNDGMDMATRQDDQCTPARSLMGRCRVHNPHRCHRISAVSGRRSRSVPPRKRGSFGRDPAGATLRARPCGRDPAGATLRARPCGRFAPPDARRRFPPCSAWKTRRAGSLQPHMGYFVSTDVRSASVTSQHQVGVQGLSSFAGPGPKTRSTSHPVAAWPQPTNIPHSTGVELR